MIEVVLTAYAVDDNIIVILIFQYCSEILYRIIDYLIGAESADALGGTLWTLLRAATE